MNSKLRSQGIQKFNFNVFNEQPFLLSKLTFFLNWNDLFISYHSLYRYKTVCITSFYFRKGSTLKCRHVSCCWHTRALGRKQIKFAQKMNGRKEFTQKIRWGLYIPKLLLWWSRKFAIIAKTYFIKKVPKVVQVILTGHELWVSQI